MNDICPITYAKERVKERGYTGYRLVFRDLQLQANEVRRIAAYNELWLILNSPAGIVIESDYGTFNYSDRSLSENIHEHADQIIIRNKSASTIKIQWLQVIMKV